MAWLLERETVITLAVLGAAVSMLATLLLNNGRITPETSKWLNRAGYAFMGASMLLFIIAGFRAPPA